ncbi:MAG: hypothetical protein IKO40_05915 [Kiritimatiellae bacterium]|nr:hypothetical protein [Kiritimatiellia bacterium]
MSAAAVAAGAVAVESANTVGVQEFGGAGDFNFTAITFEPVSGESFTLGDIKVNSAFDYGADSVSIWENGYKQFQVSYLGADDASAESVAEGWYLSSDFDDWSFTHCKNSEVLAKGKGIVFHRGTAGAALVYSGQVQSDDVTFVGFGDFNMTANTTAKAITLGQIKVNSAFDYGADSVSIWENGYKQFQVSYLGADDAQAENVAEGWYLTSDFDDWEFTHCKNNEPLSAGVGFVFHRGTTGAGIILPNPQE